MDVKDIDTECIPETMLLCGERIVYIIRKYIRFCFRELGLIDLFPLSIIHRIIDVSLAFSIGLKHTARYFLRMFAVNPFGALEKWTFPKIGMIVRLFRRTGMIRG